jgi:hypothetical protein
MYLKFRNCHLFYRRFERGICLSPVRKLNPYNMGEAVGIALISCVQAEIHAFAVYRPTSWIYSLPVQSYNIHTSLNGKLEPNIIGIAVEILLIFCLGANKHAFAV